MNFVLHIFDFLFKEDKPPLLFKNESKEGSFNRHNIMINYISVSLCDYSHSIIKINLYNYLSSSGT